MNSMSHHKEDTNGERGYSMKRSHQIAFWAGVYSFFATILAIGAINVFNPEDQLRFIGGVVVGLMTAGGVYAKQRLDDAKKGKNGGYAGDLVVKEVGDKTIFSLELNDDPELLEKKDEVVFRVKRSSSS